MQTWRAQETTFKKMKNVNHSDPRLLNVFNRTMKTKLNPIGFYYMDKIQKYLLFLG